MMPEDPKPIPNDRLSAAELFPWLNTKAAWLKSRTLWLIAAIAVLAAVLLGEDANPQTLIDSLATIVLVTYLLVLRFFLRSDIPLLTIGAVFLFVVALMKVPLLPVPGEAGLQAPMWLWLWLWRDLLPGNALENAEFIPFAWLRAFASNFFSAGLAEDSFKILPAVMAIFARRWLLKQPADKPWAAVWAKRLDMTRPTTLLMVCFASAAAFVYVETVGQYVPNRINSTGTSMLGALQGLPQDVQTFFATQAGIVQGLQLLVPRLLRFLIGHGAYAAVAGFGLVLALRHPRNTAQAVISLLLASAFLHACWNTFSNQDLLNVPIGLAAGFAMLTVCLRCMELDGEENYQAGLAFGGSIVPQRRPAGAASAARPAAPPPRPAAVSVPAMAPPPPPSVPEAGPVGALILEGETGDPVTVLLRAGAKIVLANAAPQWPQLAEASVEIVGDPAQPARLGLKNIGATNWRATAPDGREGQVEPGRVMGLLAGARLEIQGIKGRISLIAPA